MQVSTPHSQPIHERCRTYLLNAYTIIRQRRAHCELEQYLGRSLYEALENQVAERNRIKQRFARFCGRPLEPSEPQIPCPLQLASVEGKPVSYPYQVLVFGVKWPAEVNPTIRERYLSEDEFRQVFNMPFDDFQQMRQWRQLLFKKQHSLF